MTSLSKLTIDRINFALHHATELVKPLEADFERLKAHIDSIDENAEDMTVEDNDHFVECEQWRHQMEFALNCLGSAIAELDGLPKRIGGA